MLAKNHPPGTRLPKHQHRTGQLVFAVSGIMLIETEQGRWTIPPQRALWLPPQQPHAIQMISYTKMRTVYFQPTLIEQCTEFSQQHEVHAIVTSPLIKELVLGLFVAQHCHDMRDLMARLLLHALRETEYLPTYLPMPTDKKLHDALTLLMESNEWQLPMDELASRAALSTRTFTRRFSAEVGLSFRSWRQRARIIASLDLLASNHSTKFIAHRMGFASPAAYVAAFRDLMNCTPSSFREHEA